MSNIQVDLEDEQHKRKGIDPSIQLVRVHTLHIHHILSIQLFRHYTLSVIFLETN